MTVCFVACLVLVAIGRGRNACNPLPSAMLKFALGEERLPCYNCWTVNDGEVEFMRVRVIEGALCWRMISILEVGIIVPGIL